MNPKSDAVNIFRSAVAAVHPARLLANAIKRAEDHITIYRTRIELTASPKIFVTGAGKAAAAMALETEKILGSLITAGVVCTKYDHSLPAKKIKILEAGHPVPDENSVRAVEATLRLLKEISAGDIVICLISGGASALWADLPSGISLDDLKVMNDLIVRSGAPINEMNALRKHVSGIKGGQLLRHCKGAQVFTLIISDVPDDDISVIGSGPTTPDTTTFQDAYNVIKKYQMLKRIPHAIMNDIEKGLDGSLPENPKPGDLVFKHAFTSIIGNNKLALDAAAKTARTFGYETVIEEKPVTGETVATAKHIVSNALSYTRKEPICILQGGETTLKVTGTGTGGRNQHFVLAALHELSEAGKKAMHNQITILSGGTDGTDGPTNAAGAVIDIQTVEDAKQKNLSAEEYLDRFDAYNFFKETGSLLITGPTQTNVMDIIVTIINPSAE